MKRGYFKSTFTLETRKFTGTIKLATKLEQRAMKGVWKYEVIIYFSKDYSFFEKAFRKDYYEDGTTQTKPFKYKFIVGL